MLRHYIKVFLSLILLGGMLLALIPFEIIHEHKCHHQTVGHTENDEADPCHVKIYHPEKNSIAPCAHDEHFSVADKECALCKVLLPVYKKEIICSTSSKVAAPFHPEHGVLPDVPLPVTYPG